MDHDPQTLPVSTQGEVSSDNKLYKNNITTGPVMCVPEFWNPTSELRVLKTELVTNGVVTQAPDKLQRQWIEHRTGKIKWEDIPVEYTRIVVDSPTEALAHHQV